MSQSALLVVIIFVVAFQLALGFFKFKKNRKQAASKQRTGQIEFQPGTSTDNRSNSIEPAKQKSAWQGFRELIVFRREYESKEQSICSFYLRDPTGVKLPAFKAGQFLTFELEIADTSGKKHKVIRCYSLSDKYNENYYRISVKRILATKDAPAGVSSSYFHDHVFAGSTLRVKAPAGHFYLDQGSQLPVVLVAGGVGITPLLSMLNTCCDMSSRREIYLFYGVRNGDEVAWSRHLRELQKTYKNIHFQLCFSNPANVDIKDVDYQFEGRIDTDLLRNTLGLDRYQFYLCGPGPMLETLVPGLQMLGVSPDDIFYEAFGPASVNRQSATVINGSVVFKYSEEKLQWNSFQGSLLEFAEEHNINVDSGCRAGSCGSCQTRVVSGKAKYIQQPDIDVKSDHCLLCITVPDGELILDL